MGRTPNEDSQADNASTITALFSLVKLHSHVVRADEVLPNCKLICVFIRLWILILEVP